MRYLSRFLTRHALLSPKCLSSLQISTAKASSSPEQAQSGTTSAKTSFQVSKTKPSTTSTTLPCSSTISSATLRSYKRDTRLLDLDALMNHIESTSYQRAWFARVNHAVLEHMNDPSYDASHDYEHCVRVIKNAHRLWLTEKHHLWARDIDPMVIHTAALVHDIGDEKYRDEDGAESIETDEARRNRQCKTIRDMLDALKCPPKVAGPASYIASFVSFTREMNDDELMKIEMEKFPALKIVQDADRLDALGPMGIARAAHYGGVHEGRRNDTILTLVKLMDERFVHYPGLMKTKTGGEEAEKAWEYMLEFKEGMLKQADCGGILQSS